MDRPLIVSGMLRWSPERDFFIEADGGGQWLLALSRGLAEVADCLLHDRVVVEGVLVGRGVIGVVRIVARDAVTMH